jgi:hypothetical protein
MDCRGKPGNDEVKDDGQTKKGKRNAEKRCSVTAAPCDAARALKGALASRRSTTVLAAATERHRSA